ncbi:hypothetical protein PT317_01655 [Metamycoplasma hyosynoviae]|uniref:MHO_1590 family protein n=1 Tax=Metamycoplasma hyosynoviae TaxID=29559 RepID=UPI00235FED2B|nr:hypothetical protein [Metamycoplasma hyosynoviae]MDD1360703.1 hypothetical protein [Metamycoplasma hyosynoviae]MDD1362255.1 hypothetical protein [Metamycoplasma hyosynoviae]
MEKKKKIYLGLGLSTVAAIAIGATVTAILLKKKNVNKKVIVEVEKTNPETKKPNENNTGEILPGLPAEEVEPKTIFENKKLAEVDANKIFPVIELSNYYYKLNFKDGQAWIDDDMLLYIIKDITGRLAISDGIVKYSIDREDQKTVTLNFIWFNSTQKSFKSYKIFTNTI